MVARQSSEFNFTGPKKGAFEKKNTFVQFEKRAFLRPGKFNMKIQSKKQRKTEGKKKGNPAPDPSRRISRINFNFFQI